VFVVGFVNAMRPTLVLPICVVVIAALSCLGIQRRKVAAQALAAHEAATQEREVAAAHQAAPTPVPGAQAAAAEGGGPRQP
jgi:hypothetical protein